MAHVVLPSVAETQASHFFEPTPPGQVVVLGFFEQHCLNILIMMKVRLPNLFRRIWHDLENYTRGDCTLLLCQKMQAESNGGDGAWMPSSSPRTLCARPNSWLLFRLEAVSAPIQIELAPIKHIWGGRNA